MEQVQARRLLRVDSSSRVDGSHSRVVADAFERSWCGRNPSWEVVRRDLARQPLPHITAETIAGFYTPPAELGDHLRRATELSDRLIFELQQADGLLISAPMYNFSVPSSLKAWIDQIVRVGQTFTAGDDGLVGLVTTPFAVVVTASGASFTGTPFEPMDFLRPYLRGLLGFLGIRRVEFLSVEGTTLAPEAVEDAIAACERDAGALVEELASVTDGEGQS